MASLIFVWMIYIFPNTKTARLCFGHLLKQIERFEFLFYNENHGAMVYEEMALEPTFSAVLREIGRNMHQTGGYAFRTKSTKKTHFFPFFRST